MENVAIQIVNYNAPEATDKIVEFLTQKISGNHFFVVVDNGSKKELISKYTTLRLKENRNKLGGVLAAMKESKKREPTAYWTISTSMEFLPTDIDPLHELMDVLRSTENAVGIQPAFIGNLVHRPHKLMRRIEGSRFHDVEGSLGAYALYDARWLEGDGRFDERLTSSWGVDYEMKYKAKVHGKRLLISDVINVKVTEGGVYIKRMGHKPLSEYEEDCRKEMETILTEKYGANWKKVLGVEYYA